MCLFVALPTAHGYVLGSQRDDQRDRDTSPDVIFDDTRKYQYVQDLQSGGTRFTHHTDGVYAVLLNKSPSIDRTSWLQTRGNIPLQCMELIWKHQDIFEIMNRISQWDLTQYNSFQLSIGKFENNELLHIILERDAVQQQSQQYNLIWSLFLSASTLYTPEAHTKRATESIQITNRDELESFLVDHQYNTESSNCISKQWVVSKSRTIVEYTINKPIMYKYKGDI